MMVSHSGGMELAMRCSNSSIRWCLSEQVGFVLFYAEILSMAFSFRFHHGASADYMFQGTSKRNIDGPRAAPIAKVQTATATASCPKAVNEQLGPHSLAKHTVSTR